jgi:threonine/homoserine/homoserine lactone efflux protein
VNGVELAGFITASIVIIVVPGVDFALVTRQTVRYGRSAGFAVLLGLIVGAIVHATLATLGLSALLVSSETLYTVLRIAGALYLLWIGASILWATRPKKPAPAEAELVAVGAPGAPPSRGAGGGAAESEVDARGVLRRSFLMGIGSNLLNPKVILFYVAFVPQFVHPGEGAAARTAMLAATFIGLAVAWWIVYILTIDRLHDWLTRPRVQVWIERLTGAVLVVLALRLAFA